MSTGFGVYLQSTDQTVRNILFKKLLSSVVLAAPTPQIFSVPVSFRRMQYASTNAPHNDAESEEPNAEERVVCRCLICPPLPASPVSIKHHHGHEEGHAGDSQ